MSLWEAEEVNPIKEAYAGTDPCLTFSTVTPREVAVAIPVQIIFPSSSPSSTPTLDNIRIYLVSSRKHANRFVLPKGGVESGESSRTAAVRELWEEAGLIGVPRASNCPFSRSTPAELTVDDHKPHKKSPTSDPDDPTFVPRARYTGHEILLKSEEGVKQDWPEMHERERKAFTVQQAEQELEWRKDIHTIFKHWAAHISQEHQTQ